MCVCVCVCERGGGWGWLCISDLLCPILFPYRGSKIWGLSCERKTDQADFTDWMSFLLSNLMEEISPNVEARSTKT